jgi:hypothetical protein
VTGTTLKGGDKMSVYKQSYLEQGTMIDFAKAADDKHTVFGWANVSVQADGSVPLDWDGDVMSPAVLEKAAYQFVLKHRTTGEMHEGGVVGHLIESVMFTKEKMLSMGIPVGTVPEGWWVGFHIPDEEVCNKIKEGKYNMFSIQGRYRRLPL